tara:strand:+ start:411 stop:599 length:189 start_codon:yes stop_codon:yes gene_type:complete
LPQVTLPINPPYKRGLRGHVWGLPCFRRIFTLLNLWEFISNFAALSFSPKNDANPNVLINKD